MLSFCSLCFAGEKPNLQGSDIIQHGVCKPDGMDGQYYCFLLHKNGKIYVSVWQAKFDDAERTVTPEKEIRIFDDEFKLLWSEETGV